MNVSLTPELVDFVKSRVGSGRYQSDSEVVRQSLRLLEEHEVGLGELKSKIARGIKQADNGQLIEGQKVFEQLKKHSKSRRSKGPHKN